MTQWLKKWKFWWRPWKWALRLAYIFSLIFSLIVSHTLANLLKFTYIFSLLLRFGVMKVYKSLKYFFLSYLRDSFNLSLTVSHTHLLCFLSLLVAGPLSSIGVSVIVFLTCFSLFEVYLPLSHTHAFAPIFLFLRLSWWKFIGLLYFFLSYSKRLL